MMRAHALFTAHGGAQESRLPVQVQKELFLRTKIRAPRNSFTRARNFSEPFYERLFTRAERAIFWGLNQHFSRFWPPANEIFARLRRAANGATHLKL